MAQTEDIDWDKVPDMCLIRNKITGRYARFCRMRNNMVRLESLGDKKVWYTHWHKSKCEIIGCV